MCSRFPPGRNEGLRALAGRWKARFEAGDAAADLCHTANVGRAQLDRRAAIVGQKPQDFVVFLDTLAQGKAAPSLPVSAGTSSQHRR